LIVVHRCRGSSATPGVVGHGRHAGPGCAAADPDANDPDRKDPARTVPTITAAIDTV
jgi:hypothetical protein